MLYAITNDNKKIFIKNAINQEVESNTPHLISYKCPVCAQDLVIRNGLKKFPHFAHKKGTLAGSECDTFKPLLQTEWYLNCLEAVPKEYAEPVISFGREKHLADAIIKDTVFTFLHGKITPAEFEKRNRFYIKAGYKVTWLVHMGEVIKEGHLKTAYPRPFDFAWEDAYKAFNTLYPGDKNIRVYLDFQTEETSFKPIIDRVAYHSDQGLSEFSIAGECITSIEDFLTAAVGPYKKERNKDNIKHIKKLVVSSFKTDKNMEKETSDLGERSSSLGEPAVKKAHTLKDWLASGLPPVEYLMHETGSKKYAPHQYPINCPYKNEIQNNYEICSTCIHNVKEAYLPPSIYPHGRYTLCDRKGSSLPLEESEYITAVMYTPEGIIQALQTEQGGKTKIRQYTSGKQVGRTLDQLWNEKTARIRVLNMVTGWKYQINHDPKEMMKKYRGNTYAEKVCPPGSDTFVRPSDRTNELKDGNKPIWLLEWKAENP